MLPPLLKAEIYLKHKASRHSVTLGRLQPNPACASRVHQRSSTSSLPISAICSDGWSGLPSDPPDSHQSFMNRAKRDAFPAMGRFTGLFGTHIEEHAIVTLLALWNQGDDFEMIESEIGGAEEFKRVVDLMEVRGWKDRFQLRFINSFW